MNSANCAFLFGESVLLSLQDKHVAFERDSQFSKACSHLLHVPTLEHAAHTCGTVL
jgi:hypothetical protein